VFLGTKNDLRERITSFSQTARIVQINQN
jgi:hypothetical protein